MSKYDEFYQLQQQAQNLPQEYQQGLGSFGMPPDGPEYERALMMLPNVALNEQERATIISIVQAALARRSGQCGPL
jgi:hypothetical protein